MAKKSSQMKTDFTEDWSLRQAGIDYNNGLSPAYYETINANERMYAGDQWYGVQAANLPKPVFNQIKRIINHFISSIMAQKITSTVTGINVSKDGDDASEVLAREVTGFGTDAISVLWERNKVDGILRQALLDMAITGDACSYTFWDMSKNTRASNKGDITTELFDATNVFFGNPNDARVQTQPYIVLSYRALVDDIKREAKNRGAKKEIIDQISADDDTDFQAGDRSANELDGTDGSNKATVCLKLWKEYDEDGTAHVYFRKSTASVTFIEKTDTKLRLYPVAWTSWDVRKSSYHGQAPVTGLIPNQVYINKMFALMMISLMNTAFPRLVYDRTLINNPSNAVGQTYGVNGEVSKAMTFLNGAQQSGTVMPSIDAAIKYTKDMLGASDAFMGDIRPENKAAIVAVTKNAAIPLENVKANLYQFVEDNVLIWLDMMRAHYGERKVVRNVAGMSIRKTFDFSALDAVDLAVRVDVGASSYWSEIGTMQTLDAMLDRKIITPELYIEMMPDTVLSGKNKILSTMQNQNKQKQVLYTAMAQFVQSLPPEQQQEIKNTPKEEAEGKVLEMMLQMGQQMGGMPNAAQEGPVEQGGVQQYQPVGA